MYINIHFCVSILRPFFKIQFFPLSSFIFLFLYIIWLFSECSQYFFNFLFNVYIIQIECFIPFCLVYSLTKKKMLAREEKRNRYVSNICYFSNLEETNFVPFNNTEQLFQPIESKIGFDIFNFFLSPLNSCKLRFKKIANRNHFNKY